MPQPSSVRPPRLAGWLVDLFITDEQTESIPGDLLEEFLGLASESGIVVARRWYWRQSVKTVVHLIGSGFRVAPWRIVGALLMGHTLITFGFRLPEKAIVAVLRSNPFHIEFSVLWNLWVPLAIQFGRVIWGMSIGCIAAMAAKGREMVVTVMLGFSFGALIGIAFLALATKHWPEYYLFLPGLVWGFAVSIAIIIGGGIVRKTRSAASRRASARP